jgi:CubicO group peptidase (beta-lactamase class C family)
MRKSSELCNETAMIKSGLSAACGILALLAASQVAMSRGIKILRPAWLPISCFASTPAKTRPLTLPDEATIRGWLKSSNVPLAGIGLIEGGQIKQAKVFGDPRPGTAAPNDILFNVASLTKPVVAMLTLKLVSQGRWDMNEPLAHYFVEADLANDPNLSKVTTRLVLTHETGLPNWRGNEPGKKLSFAFEPGTGVKYSGEAYQYLRQALEQKFKQPLDELARSLILGPWGMKDTRFYWDSSMTESRYAGRYDKDGKVLELEKWYEPHGANLLLTTVGDYSRFATHVLRGGDLSKDVYREMVTPHVPTGAATDATKNSFGLCWRVVRDLSDGEYALVHSGRNPGITAIVILLPQSQRGIVVLTNGENGEDVYKKVIGESLDLGTEILGRLN